CNAPRKSAQSIRRRRADQMRRLSRTARGQTALRSGQRGISSKVSPRRTAMRRVLLWFKQDLRLDDHPAVQAAMAADRLLPLYVFDPALLQPGPLGSRRLGVHRARFLMESLAALDGELRQRGSGLLVLQGRAEQLIPRLVEQLDLDAVLTLDEIAPEECAQLAALQRTLGPALQRLPGNEMLRAADLPCPPAQLPGVFSRFRELVEQRLSVFQPRPAPARLP